MIFHLQKEMIPTKVIRNKISQSLRKLKPNIKFPNKKHPQIQPKINQNVS
jgi:hypothetical protein